MGIRRWINDFLFTNDENLDMPSRLDLMDGVGTPGLTWKQQQAGHTIRLASLDHDWIAGVRDWTQELADGYLEEEPDE